MSVWCKVVPIVPQGLKVASIGDERYSWWGSAVQSSNSDVVLFSDNCSQSGSSEVNVGEWAAVG